ncbi:MAG TPA: GNAT family N-acetyltransferase [Bryobacteraceae bacterium]
MIVLETERLRLRTWKQADREPFARLNADPRVREFFPGVLSKSESDAEADRVEEHFSRHEFTFFAAELRESGEFIGCAGLAAPSFEAHFTPCVEIGWRLAQNYWGRGLATEAARAVLRHGFEVLRLNEIVAFTVPANVPSRRIMEKIEMTRDPAEDFDHPALPEGHPLRRHVLYRIKSSLLP